MRNRHAVLDFVRRLDVRDVPVRLWGASTALVRRTWGSERPPRALKLLAPSERALLRRFLHENTRTLRVPTVASVAIGLELADIVSISREPEPASTGAAFVLGVNPWAWAYLRRHPEILGAEGGQARGR